MHHDRGNRSAEPHRPAQQMRFDGLSGQVCRWKKIVDGIPGKVDAKHPPISNPSGSRADQHPPATHESQLRKEVEDDKQKEPLPDQRDVRPYGGPPDPPAQPQGHGEPGQDEPGLQSRPEQFEPSLREKRRFRESLALVSIRLICQSRPPIVEDSLERPAIPVPILSPLS